MVSADDSLTKKFRSVLSMGIASGAGLTINIGNSGFTATPNIALPPDVVMVNDAGPSGAVAD